MSDRSEVEHPTPPENVRIVRPDGTEIPMIVQYMGTTISDDDGGVLHLWEAIAEYLPDIPGDQIKMDMLPARTTIQLAFRRPDGG